MDEELKVVDLTNSPWLKEEIPNQNFLYRQCPSSQRLKDDQKRRFPNEAHFELRKDRNETDLSFNWDKYSTPEICLLLIGLHKSEITGKYLNPTSFLIFKYRAGALKEMVGVKSIKHSPDFFGDPSEIGFPNNPSHTSLFMADELQFQMDIVDYVNANKDELLCTVDLSSVENQLKNLQASGNNNEYHKLWKFPVDL